MNETARIALTALRTNKLRSALTMLGVAIGVFSVIGVMTALSVIATSIEFAALLTEIAGDFVACLLVQNEKPE